AACAILSYSVLGRALFHAANYWQDEAAVFLLVGATFLTSAYVQGQRGHIGIEAFVGLLSPLANRIRLWLVDWASPLFCAFFTWKLRAAGLESVWGGPGLHLVVAPAAGDPLQLDGRRHAPALRADPAADHSPPDRTPPPMSVFGIGVSYGLATLFAMFS